jgi:hypothetical protein
MKTAMRSGWREQGDTPAVFLEHASQQNGVPAGPFIEARLWDASSKLLHAPDKIMLDVGGTTPLLDSVGFLLAQLRTPEASKAELLFVNLGARKPMFTALSMTRFTTTQAISARMIPARTFAHRVAVKV